MDVIFYPNGWNDYQYWLDNDLKLLKKINKLIKECQSTPFEGTGKPEPLKSELSGWWSRRINRKHRLVYRVKGGALEIAQCRHYW
jgi:toxin YoeB